MRVNLSYERPSSRKTCYMTNFPRDFFDFLNKPNRNGQVDYRIIVFETNQATDVRHGQL